MKNATERDEVQTILDDAERAATTAVRLMRLMLAVAAPGAVVPLLEDVDGLFRLLDHADARAQLARTSVQRDDALEYAEDARDLARAARDEARRRARRTAPGPRDGVALGALDLLVIGSVPAADA